MEIVTVTTPHQVRQFLEMPERVYPIHSPWVAPLQLHIRQLMGDIQDPQRRFYLLLDGHQPLARLGVRQVGQHLHFGFFEATPQAQSQIPRLFERLRTDFSATSMRGPFHFGLEDPYTGLLVDGFEQPPTLFLPYNPPHYGAWLEQAGLHKEMDLFCYEFTVQKARPELLQSRASLAYDQGVRIRPMSFWQRRRDLEAAALVFNAALAANWGFEPIVGAQLEDLILLGRTLLYPEQVLFATLDRDGHQQIVGCLIVAPDYNNILQAARGRVGWRLLWNLLWRRRNILDYRGYALCVHPDFQHLDVASALLNQLFRLGQTTPWRRLEVAWVLENNRKMNAMARALGGIRCRTYRLFEGKMT